jgi:hypothetical protein
MAIDRNYRPPPTGNHVTDVALRQILDHVYDLRNNYGPSNVFGQGPPNANPVTVPAKPKPASGINVSVALDRPGNWLLTAAVTLHIIGDPGQIFTLTLSTGSVLPQPQTAQWNSATDGQVILHQTWQIPSVKGSLNCRLLIMKDGGAGTSFVDPVNSTLSGLWQGPLG